MLGVRLVLVVAVLNLTYLFSEIFLNIIGVALS